VSATAQATTGRVVILGASNCTRGISTIITAARRLLGSPLEVHAAIGHGRSYGLRSRVLARALPGIIDCRLWGAIGASDVAGEAGRAAQRQRLRAGPTFALITDIGNDVMYGADPEQIAAWVAMCIERLRSVDARIVMTQLPMESLWRLSGLRFEAARRVFFPLRRIEHEEALARADELNTRLFALARERGVALAELPREWFGLDPIHIRMRMWPVAWPAVLRHWRDEAAAPGPEVIRADAAQWLRLKRMRPLERWVFGRRRRADQPAGTLGDGTVVSMY
jgi:hypothetical protein